MMWIRGLGWGKERPKIFLILHEQMHTLAWPLHTIWRGALRSSMADILTG